MATSLCVRDDLIVFIVKVGNYYAMRLSSGLFNWSSKRADAYLWLNRAEARAFAITEGGRVKRLTRRWKNTAPKDPA